MSGFNPSRGIAIIQTSEDHYRILRMLFRFNPSRGIAIIQTLALSIGQWYYSKFQSLTRDSNHSNLSPCWHEAFCDSFQSLTRDSNHSNSCCAWWRSRGSVFQSLTRDSNHSNAILLAALTAHQSFQSLTRDSNHSNRARIRHADTLHGFNPSRGIAIIQTLDECVEIAEQAQFQSLTRDSNHSNLIGWWAYAPRWRVSIPHAG